MGKTRKRGRRAGKKNPNPNKRQATTTATIDETMMDDDGTINNFLAEPIIDGARAVESSLADPEIFGSLELFDDQELPCDPSIFGAPTGFNSSGEPEILGALDPDGTINNLLAEPIIDGARAVESSLADPEIFGSLELFDDQLPCDPSIFGAPTGFNSSGEPEILGALDPDQLLATIFQTNQNYIDLPIVSFPYSFYFESMLPSWLLLKPTERTRLMALGPFMRSCYVDKLIEVQQTPTSWQTTLAESLNHMPHYQAMRQHPSYLAFPRTISLLDDGGLQDVLHVMTPGHSSCSLLDKLPLQDLINHVYDESMSTMRGTRRYWRRKRRRKKHRVVARQQNRRPLTASFSFLTLAGPPTSVRTTPTRSPSQRGSLAHPFRWLSVFLRPAPRSSEPWVAVGM
jgi:hypothetical protein